MRKILPKSILQLVLIGFFVVLSPLILGIIYGGYSLGRLADQGEASVKNLVTVTRNAQSASDLTKEMERLVRQYQLLKDPKLLKLLEQRSESLAATLRVLQTAFPPKAVGEWIEPLMHYNAELRSLSAGIPADPDQVEHCIGIFEDTAPLIVGILQSSRRLEDRKISESNQVSVEARENLAWLSLTIIPATLGLIAVFTTVIARPMRQLYVAINTLGDGNFDSPVTVDGPRDLKNLGMRLNWLGRRLYELEKQKQRFLRHMSHELKTPLTALREGGELLEDEIPGTLNDNQKEVVQILNQNIGYFQRVIENLLDYNFLQSDTPLMLSKIQFPSFVDEVTAAHTLTARRKKIGFRKDGPPLAINADRKKLRTALDNLISNGLSFTPENKDITIQWHSRKGKFIMQVADEGPGIPDSEEEKIFSPFYQGSASRKGPIKGSGIGLSVARECIQAHDGTLNLLKSKNGACFEIMLPGYS